MAILLILLIYRGQLSARDSAVANLNSLTSALSMQFDLVFSDAEFQFQSLNGVDQIAAGDRATCDAWLAANMPKKPSVNGLFRLTPDGVITCSSRELSLGVITEAAFNLDDPSIYETIRVAPARTSKTSGETIIALGKAYWNDGDPYQIVITLDAQWFYNATAQFIPLDDRKVFILNDLGQIILQLPNFQEQSVQRAPSFNGFVTLKNSPNIHRVEVGVDGDSRIVSSVIMHTFQDGRVLSLSVSGSPIVLFAKAHAFIALGIGTLVLAVIGVVFAQQLLFSRYLARPIGAILQYAQTLQKGTSKQALVLPAAAPQELSDLGNAIARMSDENTDRAAALSEALANLERAQDIAKMGHWRLDLRTDELRWSDGVYKLHGLERDTFTPTLEKAISLYHPDDRALVQQATEDSIALLQPYEFENRIIRGDGSYIYVSARGQVTVDEDGVPIAMFGIVIDVDAPKQAERELKRAQLAAQQLADTRATFLETVTHEVRTPLSAMLSIVEGFKTADLSPEQVEQVRLLDASGQLLMNVICDLLDSASVDAGAIRLVETNTAPQGIIDSCFVTFKTAYETDQVKFYQETSGEEPSDVLLDAQRLRQVIFNILGNAVKHTHSGRIGIETHYGAEAFSVAVRDTGAGIAHSEQKRIFDRFVEGVGSSSGSVRGTGLGLHIVKTLVTNMGGSVRVESQRGEGSCFIIDLPYRKAAAEPATSFQGPSTAARQGDILVVEDNPVNQKLLTAFLKRSGYSYVVQNDGQFAVEWLLSQPADALPPIALIDVNMPRMNGIELCEFIRQQLPGGEALPLYLVTADILADYESKIRQLKINGCVTKPIDFGALQAIISAHVFKGDVETAA